MIEKRLAELLGISLPQSIEDIEEAMKQRGFAITIKRLPTRDNAYSCAFERAIYNEDRGQTEQQIFTGAGPNMKAAVKRAAYLTLTGKPWEGEA